MVALVDGQPRLLNLSRLIDAFMRHRREVVTRRTVSNSAKRANAASAGRARGGAGECRRSDRADQGGGHAGGCESGLMETCWRSRLVRGLLARASDASRSRPDGSAGGIRIHAEWLPLVGNAGAGRSWNCGCSGLTGARAGQDRRRIQAR